MDLHKHSGKLDLRLRTAMALGEWEHARLAATELKLMRVNGFDLHPLQLELLDAYSLHPEAVVEEITSAVREAQRKLDPVEVAVFAALYVSEAIKRGSDAATIVGVLRAESDVFRSASNG